MKFVTATLLAAVLAATTAGARAQEGAAVPLQQGSYAVLEGGVNIAAPTNLYDSFVPATFRAKVKQGWALSGAGGYKWSNGLRTEVEFSYHRNSYKDFNTSALLFTGRQVTASVMGNVLYDVNTGTRFTPYIGGGVGGTMAWLKDLTQVNRNILGIRNNESMKVAFQGIVGVAIAIAPQFETIIDARYRVSNGHHFDLVAPDYLSKYNIHELTVMAGFRYAF